MQRLVLPDNITYLRDLCFYNAQIDELHLPTRRLRSLGQAFHRFFQDWLDLSEAVELTVILEQCFKMATLQRLVLPRSITTLGDMCFDGARIDERILPQEQLRTLNESAFVRFRTDSWDFSEATLLATISARCFDLAKMDRLVLPASITELGSDCFGAAEIDELVVPIKRLRTLGAAFMGFHEDSLDLSDATDLTTIPANCFTTARIRRLSLPVSITALGDTCFDGARIDELHLPRKQLRTLGKAAIVRVHTGSLDLSEATQLKSFPARCYHSAEIRRLALPASITALGDHCFNTATIDELILPTKQLRTLGKFFTNFRLNSLDLSEADELTTIPDGCLLCAEIGRLVLPPSITHVDEVCLYGAKIGELVSPRQS